MGAITDTENRQKCRRRDFEQKVVYKILWRAGKIGLIRQFKAEHFERSGSVQLTLEWFRKRFPAFPLRLGAALLPDSTSPAWTDVFRRFTTTGFFEAYRWWREDQQLDDHHEPVGLVFNMDSTTLVLHNLAGSATAPGVQVIRAVGQPPVTFILETFGSFLGSLGTSWAQENTAKRQGG